MSQWFQREKNFNFFFCSISSKHERKLCVCKTAGLLNYKWVTDNAKSMQEVNAIKFSVHKMHKQRCAHTKICATKYRERKWWSESIALNGKYLTLISLINFANLIVIDVLKIFSNGNNWFRTNDFGIFLAQEHTQRIQLG